MPKTELQNHNKPDIKYWLGFSKIYSIGTIHLRRLLDHFESIEQCWNATTADLLRIEGFTSHVAGKFQREKQELGELERLEEDISERNIRVITLNDADYPYYLKQIYDPPIVLYVKGDFERVNAEKCLAVVGSRRASNSIKPILNKIVNGLRGSGITVVSGMAAGIDTYAHNAALEANLPTLAVLGSGFDYIYPTSNKGLFKKISDGNGAVISEYYPDVQPIAWHFPRRNRIVTGLSQGTLVAEASLKSGALISARLTLEQDRELMCIPGMVSNPNTEGTHNLIKEGAAVVTEAADIMNHMDWEYEFKEFFLTNNVKLLDKEKKVYEILELESKSFDELINESKLSAENLMTTLTTMELNGVITQLPGQKFAKT